MTCEKVEEPSPPGTVRSGDQRRKAKPRGIILQRVLFVSEFSVYFRKSTGKDHPELVVAKGGRPTDPQKRGGEAMDCRKKARTDEVIE